MTARNLPRYLLTALSVIVALTVAVGLVASPSRGGNRHPGNAHWNDGDRSQAWVTFVDRTGQPWPVFDAAVRWDFAGNVSVTYSPDNCGGNGHCTPVDASNFPSGTCGPYRAAWIGFPQAGNHWDPGTTAIALNNHCRDSHTRRERRVLTCQEEGNILGLRDEGPGLANETCMGDGASLANTREVPREHDFVMLDDRIYDHSG